MEQDFRSCTATHGREGRGRVALLASSTGIIRLRQGITRASEVQLVPQIRSIVEKRRVAFARSVSLGSLNCGEKVRPKIGRTGQPNCRR